MAAIVVQKDTNDLTDDINSIINNSAEQKCSTESNKNHQNTAIDLKRGNFKLHVFTDEIVDKRVVFQIIQMTEQVFIMINYEGNMHLSDLSVAMPNKYDNLPISTSILGGFVNDFSKNLSLKLARRLKKCVFLSCNIDADKFFVQGVERSLYKEIKRNPNKF